MLWISWTDPHITPISLITFAVAGMTVPTSLFWVSRSPKQLVVLQNKWMMGSFCASTGASLSKPPCALHLLKTLTLPAPGEAAPQGISVFQESQEAKVMHTPQEAPPPLFSWGISKVSCLQVFKQFRFSLCSRGAQTLHLLPVLRNRTERKKMVLDFFLHNLPVNSRENFILENKVAYF